ncbi:GNAT family N-acetyltransferase [Ideonella sp. BN130291]|uniref:GNAT family N-acetyltransferase n=1 Tax=Ideonella sp. BN130291 TaxID=3112940 RepID=UPI002E256288|nr:GNAT family N-acetyltransferase [Ideonella sp. BN130291]
MPSTICAVAHVHRSKQPTVRVAVTEDAHRISDLLPHLGYQVSADEASLRLAYVLGSPNHAVFVAEAHRELVGLCLLAGVRHIASAGYAEVMELVVHSGHQGQGVGRSLLQQAEAWAVSQGYGRVRLRSGVQREEAHQFYERLGYSRSRASYAFERTLAAIQPPEPTWVGAHRLPPWPTSASES